MTRGDSRPSDDAGRPLDLAAVLADDALLDSLGRRARSGSGRHRSTSGPLGDPAPRLPGDDRLSDLFLTWRAGIEAEPEPVAPDVEQVARAMGRAARRRSLRPMLGVAVAICGLLVGSGAIGARTAHPGDVLWPVAQVLWADRADSVMAGDTARVALGQARMALDAGLTSEARSALVVASTALPRVADRDGHQVLKADLDSLWTTLDWVQQQHAVAAPAPAPATESIPVAPPPADPSVPSSSAGTDSGTGTTGSSAGPVDRSPSSPDPSGVTAPTGPTGTSAPQPPVSPTAPPAVVTPSTPTPPSSPTPTTPSSPPVTGTTTSPPPSSSTPSTGPTTSSADTGSTTSPSSPSTSTPSATQEGIVAPPTDTTATPTSTAGSADNGADAVPYLQAQVVTTSVSSSG